MASRIKRLGSYPQENAPNAKPYRFGIVVSEYHEDITLPLLEGAKETLIKHGALEENIKIMVVPGAYELISGSMIMADGKDFLPNAIISLGCVIKGDTRHDEYINMAVAQGLSHLSIASGIPCIFGLLTTENHTQAVERSGGKHGNKGTEAAYTALRMANIGEQFN